MPTNFSLPLPRRISWPWSQPAERVEFSKTFQIVRPARVSIYIACSSNYQVQLDGVELSVPISHLPSWRSMHRYNIEIQSGEHNLSIIINFGQQAQPFLLANLDWVEDNLSKRIVTVIPEHTRLEWHTQVRNNH